MQDALGSQAAWCQRQLELLPAPVQAADCPRRLRSEGQNLCCGWPGAYIKNDPCSQHLVTELQAALLSDLSCY